MCSSKIWNLRAGNNNNGYIHTNDRKRTKTRKQHKGKVLCYAGTIDSTTMGNLINEFSTQSIFATEVTLQAQQYFLDYCALG